MLVLLALAAVPALSGCGGGGEDSSTATTTGTSSETAENRNSGEEGKGEGGGKDGKSSGGSQGSSAPQPEGEEEPGITPEQEREVTKADVTLESPSFPTSAVLPAKYTCDGADTWPALRWKGLPPEVGELVLLVLSVRPADQKLVFNWAVAGLDPSLSEIEEGKLPAGAVVGENSFGKDGYSICPEAGSAENYIFMLFAIPDPLDPEPGFDARELRAEVLAQHGNVGLLSASYARK